MTLYDDIAAALRRALGVTGCPGLQGTRLLVVSLAPAVFYYQCPDPDRALCVSCKHGLTAIRAPWTSAEILAHEVGQALGDSPTALAHALGPEFGPAPVVHADAGPRSHRPALYYGVNSQGMREERAREEGAREERAQALLTRRKQRALPWSAAAFERAWLLPPDSLAGPEAELAREAACTVEAVRIRRLEYEAIRPLNGSRRSVPPPRLSQALLNRSRIAMQTAEYLREMLGGPARTLPGHSQMMTRSADLIQRTAERLAACAHRLFESDQRVGRDGRPPGEYGLPL